MQQHVTVSNLPVRYRGKNKHPVPLDEVERYGGDVAVFLSYIVFRRLNAFDIRDVANAAKRAFALSRPRDVTQRFCEAFAGRPTGEQCEMMYICIKSLLHDGYLYRGDEKSVFVLNRKAAEDFLQQQTRKC